MRALDRVLAAFAVVAMAAIVVTVGLYAFVACNGIVWVIALLSE